MSCRFRVTIPEENLTICTAYSHAIRPDGFHWAHYPECENCNCPIDHPSLLEDAILCKGE